MQIEIDYGVADQILVANLLESFEGALHILESDVEFTVEYRGNVSNEVKANVEDYLEFMWSVITVLRWFTAEDYKDEEALVNHLENEYYGVIYGN